MIKNSLTREVYLYNIESFTYNKDSAKRLIDIQNDIEYMSSLIGYLNDNKEKGFIGVDILKFLYGNDTTDEDLKELKDCSLRIIIKTIESYCFKGFIDSNENIDFFITIRKILDNFIEEYDKMSYEENDVIYLTQLGYTVIGVLAYVSSFIFNDIMKIIESIYGQWFESKKYTIGYKDFGQYFFQGIFSQNKIRIIYNLKF